MQFNQIPPELQRCRQWINWRYQVITADRKPTKIPVRSRDGNKAAVNNPLDFGSFEEAVKASAKFDGIGFVFTKSDPFVGIDLDYTEDAAEIAWQQQIYAGVASYTEWSPSGKGLHIVCKGILTGGGKRRNSVEIYDNLRFFTFTGNRVNDWHCEHRQAAVDYLYQMLGFNNEVRPGKATLDEPAERSDYDVFQAAANAANGDKFMRLYNGDWRTDYGHHSSSDGISNNQADFALINILAFYTHNRAQIARIFRLSGIAQRPKSQFPRNSYRGNDLYINDMITRAFDRLPAAADMDELHNQRVAILSEIGLPA